MLTLTQHNSTLASVNEKWTDTLSQVKWTKIRLELTFKLRDGVNAKTVWFFVTQFT